MIIKKRLEKANCTQITCAVLGVETGRGSERIELEDRVGEDRGGERFEMEAQVGDSMGRDSSWKLNAKKFDVEEHKVESNV